MDFLPTLISIVSVSLAILGAFVTLFQWRGANRMKRAEIVNGLIGLIRTDEYIHAVLQIIDYDESWYTDAFHNGKNNDLERQVDRTFSYFSYICYMRKKKLLSTSEFSFFEYDLMRILRNSDSSEYLHFIYSFSSNNDAACPFKYLIEYGFEKGVLNWKT